MSTYSAKETEVQRRWWVIDATDQVLGRVAVKAANLLRGKEKAMFTPHVTQVILWSSSTPTRSV